MFHRKRLSQPIRTSLASYVTYLGVIMLVTSSLASTHAHRMSNQPQFFQLDDGTENEALTGQVLADDGSEPNRLMELLTVQDSMENMLYPQSNLAEHRNSGTDASRLKDISDVENGEDLAGMPDAPPADKRVFCNGFTGCGGRFREQRRQGPKRTNKRVFCNSQGCFNGGRKRGMENVNNQRDSKSSEVSDDSTRVDLALWEEALRRLAQFERTRLRQLSKRLFCNGFGGCQNKGKRQQVKRGSEPEADVKVSLPRLKILRDADHLRGKRFFVGQADQQVDAINSQLCSDNNSEDEDTACAEEAY